MVGGPCLHRRRRDQCGHLSRDAGRGLQDPCFFLRTTGHRHRPGQGADRLHLHRPLLPVRGGEYLRVSDREIRTADQEHGERDLSLHAGAGHRGSALSGRGDPGRHLAPPLPGGSGDSRHLFLGDPHRHTPHNALHRRGRDQGRGLDRSHPGGPDAGIRRLRPRISGGSPRGYRGGGQVSRGMGLPPVDQCGLGRLPSVRKGLLLHAGGTLHPSGGPHRLDLPDHGHPRHRSGHGPADADRTRSGASTPLTHSERTCRHPHCPGLPGSRNPSLALLR